MNSPAEEREGNQTVPRCISVELPLPPIEASPNGRFHWGPVGRAVGLYRQNCAVRLRWATKGHPPFSPPIVVHLDFYLCRGAGDFERSQNLAYTFPRDLDNAVASCKACLDSLQDAGIVPSDGAAYVRLGETRLHTRKADHQGRTCLVMTICEAEG